MRTSPTLVVILVASASIGCAPSAAPAPAAPTIATPTPPAAPARETPRAATVELAPDLLANARDPFQHALDPVELPPTDACASRDVRLCRLGLDELRLIGVVDGSDGPYAMVVDPAQRGTTLRRGMYVGRPEVLRTAQGALPAYWRVARIEPGRFRRGEDGAYVEQRAAVVFERVDPAPLGGAPVERRVVASRGS